MLARFSYFVTDDKGLGPYPRSVDIQVTARDLNQAKSKLIQLSGHEPAKMTLTRITEIEEN